ncbi:hypothetical protein HK57_00453 [Aspergillus ustus]|uniref:Uncharacterized protein n=1 Tax=Aspergillus ustus TaxID=40382 RepID=A0A0C1E2K4_ASPUT|nr:hypothetical protein HK57_00453 [Aspergillus ustus]
MPSPPGGGRAAANVARILDQAGIPYALWGWLALAILARDRECRDIDFIIPDALINSAVDKLNASGLFGRVCTSEDCPELREDRVPANHLDHWKDLPQEQRLLTPAHAADITSFDRYHPVADAHFHIQPRYGGYSILALHKQSYILASWNDLDLGASNPNIIMVTTDPRLTQEYRRSGPWTDLSLPIKVLTPWACVEALMLLLCRDFDHYLGLSDCWELMLGTLVHADADIKGRLSAEFVDPWEGLMERRFPDEGCWDAFEKLQERLIREHRVTDFPPKDPYRWL